MSDTREIVRTQDVRKTYGTNQVVKIDPATGKRSRISFEPGVQP